MRKRTRTKNKRVKKNIKDNGFKKIFGDKQLFCEFIKSFINIEILKDIKPSDVEDISGRFINIYKENIDSDTVKKVKLKNEEFFVICLVEHQSTVHYLMCFRILEYMTLIWKDYIEKIDIEAQKKKRNAHPSKLKSFKLPPILPIVFYEGKEKWTAELEFKNKIILNDIFEKYTPKFEYELVDLNEYTKQDLLKLNNLLSLILLIDKIKSAKDFELLKEIPKEYVDKVIEDTPNELLKMVADIVKNFLEKVNVPSEEIENITEKIYERRFVEMFTMFEEYDVQATRKEAEEVGYKKGIQKGKQEGIQEGIKIYRIEMAEKLLKLGESSDKIKILLELSDQQIEEIKKSL